MGATIKKTNAIFFNHSFDKKRLKRLISWVFKKSGEAEALKVLDLLKKTGFKYATKAGISIGLHDLTTPLQKSWLISESQLAMNTTDRDFIGAKITATERSQRIIDTWHRASESLSKQVVDYFGIYDQFNPVYIMALSGARGNFSQVRQLIGMRGLMADQQGKIVNFPIRSNLREGLTLTEYFISCSGARKGLVDTALRTADTGYLTRRLVDVSHHVVVKRIRCNTNRGIAFKSLQSYNKVLLALKERLVGRVLAEDVEIPFYRNENETLLSCLQDKKEKRDLPIAYTNEKRVIKDTLMSHVPPFAVPYRNPSCHALSYPLRGGQGQSSKSIAKKDQEISPKLSLKISQVRDKVFIRSPLTCGFIHSVCQLCYGWSISQGSLVSLGDAVGVIAAQSIGEPGTQLTMRTFHTGGVFSGDLLQEIRAPHAGTIRFSKAFQGLLIRSAHGRIAFLSKTQGSLVLTDNRRSLVSRESSSTTVKKGNNFTEIPIQAFTMLFVRQGENVEKNQLLAEFSIQKKEGNQPIKTQQTIFADLSGRVIEDSSGTVYTKSIKESAILLDPVQETSSFCKSSGTAYKESNNKKRLHDSKESCCFTYLRAHSTKTKQSGNKNNKTLQKGIRGRSYLRFVSMFLLKQNVPPFAYSVAATAYVRTKRSFVCEALYAQLCAHGLGTARAKAPIAFLFDPAYRALQKQKGGRDQTRTRQMLVKMRKKLFCFYACDVLSTQKGVRQEKLPFLAIATKKVIKPAIKLNLSRNKTVPIPLQNKSGRRVPVLYNCTKNTDRRDKKMCATNALLLRKSVKAERKERTKTGLETFSACTANRKCKMNQTCNFKILPSFKREDLENDIFKYIEPARSGRLGFLKILSTRVGATLDYTCPIKPFDRNFVKKKKTQKMNVRRTSYVFEGFSSQVPERSGSKKLALYRLSNKDDRSSLLTKTIDHMPHAFSEKQKAGMQSQIGRVADLYEERPTVSQIDNARTKMYETARKRKNNTFCFLRNQLNYLHPEYKKETRFFLQSIAEYGDIVDEAYKVI